MTRQWKRSKKHASCWACLWQEGRRSNHKTDLPGHGDRLSDGFDLWANFVFEDIVVDSQEKPRMVSIRIKLSKTDRLRRGTMMALHWTGESLRPVRAVFSIIVKRKAGPEQLLTDRTGVALTRRHFVVEVRLALVVTGMNYSDISGHSFRISSATAAAQVGPRRENRKT